jgi:glycosyltransferase involved in cell wall biosynthesis
MNKSSPFFFVIIPTYNRREYLEIALQSVLEQTFPNFEVIVIDDGSTDKTNELISSYTDQRIVYYDQANYGVAHARNRGLERAGGGFIAFLDSDDRWLPKKLERALDYIQRYPSIRIFHTEEKWCRQGKILNPQNKYKKPNGFVYKNVLPLCCIGMSTAVIHREVFNSIGNFDEALTACEDYDFWLRATYRNPVKLIPEYLTIKDGGRPDQLSSRVWGLDRFRITALAKMLSFGKLEEKDYELTLQEIKKKVNVFVKGAKKRGRLQEANRFKELITTFEDSKRIDKSSFLLKA